MYRNTEADAMHEAGLAAAERGDLEQARQALDETLRTLERDPNDTGFLRAGVMCDLALVFLIQGDALGGHSDHYEWAFQTLWRAEGTSTGELSRHFQPGKGYVGITEADQAAVHLQICIAHIGMGTYYGMRAARQETDFPESTKGLHEGEAVRRWLAQHHFERARAFDPDAAAAFEQSLGRFALRAAFWDIPPEQPQWTIPRGEVPAEPAA